MKKNQKNNIGIISLGCPRNLVDSEGILGRLKEKKYRIVDIKDAHIGIVNTCAFIKEAKEESIETILDLIELKKQGRLKKIIVCGCLSERYREKLASHLKEIDAFVGRVALEKDEPLKRYALTPKHFAYVKISEGCKNACSYCVIPRIKGAFTSRLPASILGEIKELDKKGVAEINIIGQDITSYGTDLGQDYKLLDLLREIIASVKNISWIRLLYLHPRRISDGLIDFIAKEERICKYIDLPIQHINDAILKKMNRHTTKAQIISLIKKMRQRIPWLAIRTSLIVGFPGETDAQFEELLDFIKEVKFERLGVFMYSKEEGTRAYNFKDQIPQVTKKARLDTLMQAQQQIAAELNQAYLNKEIEVLIDEKGDSDNIYLGRSRFDAPEVDGLVYVRSSRKLKSGNFVRVKITDTYEYDLVGEQIYTVGDHR